MAALNKAPGGLAGRRFYIASDGARLRRILGLAYLFVPDRQLLFAVTPTVAALWPRIEAGVFEDDLRTAAAELGEAVDPLLADLVESGAVTPLGHGRGRSR